MKLLALAAALLVAASARAPAQQLDSSRALEVRPLLKDPDLAPVLAIAVSGGAQIYAGRAREGWTRFATTLVGAALSIYGNTRTCVNQMRERDCNFLQYVGAPPAAMAWVFGVLNARDDVREYNRRASAPRSNPTRR